MIAWQCTVPVSYTHLCCAADRYVTGYILIARADKSDIRNVKNAVSILENVSANILGFILNDINPKRSQKYNYDYKYGYDYKY